VERVLESLDSCTKPCITVYNKTDLVPGFKPPAGKKEFSPVAVSALEGHGLEGMLAAIAEVLSCRRIRTTFFIPYRKTGVLSMLHEKGKVYREKHGQDGVSVEAELEIVWAKRIEARLKE
jgi:GTP-binding protein HflX